jgi:hypothetical protein
LSGLTRFSVLTWSKHCETEFESHAGEKAKGDAAEDGHSRVWLMARRRVPIIEQFCRWLATRLRNRNSYRMYACREEMIQVGPGSHWAEKGAVC